MITRGRVVWIVLLGTLAALVAWGLEATRPRANWLALETPPRVLLPGTVPIRVHLLAPETNGFLKLEIHWRTTAGEGRGYLTGMLARITDHPGRVFNLELTLPDPPGLESINVFTFTSPTGRIAERTHLAQSEAIPVEHIRVPFRNPDTAMRRWRVYRPEADAPKPAAAPRSRLLRGLIVLLLLGSAAALSGGAQRARHLGIPVSPKLETFTRLLILAFLAGALVEALEALDFLAERVREFAMSRSLYRQRGTIQYAATFGLLTLGLFGVAWVVFRMPSPALQTTLVGAGLGGTILLVGAMSLNGVDRIDAAIPGLSILQVARLACALLAFTGALGVALNPARLAVPPGTPPDPNAGSRSWIP